VTHDAQTLAWLGFLMVAGFMALIMTGRLSPLVALITVPTAVGLAAGFGAGLGPMMLEGVARIAPTAVMLMFAILYFGVMGDAGLFDPLIKALLRVVGEDPVRIVMGTVALATFVSLDGDGSTTYMITVAALLPLYRRLGLNPLIMACLIMLSSGVMNLTPWGGPTARAASALGLDATAVFLPLVPAMLVAIAWLMILGWAYGRAERRRLGGLSPKVSTPAVEVAPAPGRFRFWINLGLTLSLLGLLMLQAMPLPLLFMLAFCLALVINHPKPADQRARIAAHAPAVLAVVSVIFAAGVFTGILNGTGMVTAMSGALVDLIPPALGPHLAPLTALISLPMTFFISNDAFYFGMLPVLAETAGHYGVAPLHVASASLIGQPLHLLSPLVPSTYLLVSLAGVEFGAHQRFTLPWAILTCLVMLAAALALGAFPWRAA
jgi:CitMHS family citrate-Mg2+:H+ or citrate-Ca2+:H+ symporter